ncbi:serine-rich and transmembrane domain-containing protein 1-like [Coregonus clupeaformis]|uniref:serine-rich and transmembrane domain-containing protein 1-like n=1 Tax=Coregonus clupeaformis TaxID=59861 RepID=UPI001E1C3CC0|nr:serine-rich and transmembrane domain-containing protein 1-like [Coregonus clupeaformis]
MSGMDLPLDVFNGTGISPDNGTFLKFSPTSVSMAATGAGSSLSAGSSPGQQENVYVYVWIFLSLLVFLLTLLVIALRRLKNIITSSSSVPDCRSQEGSSFNKM